MINSMSEDVACTDKRVAFFTKIKRVTLVKRKPHKAGNMTYSSFAFENCRFTCSLQFKVPLYIRNITVETAKEIISNHTCVCILRPLKPH